MNVLPPTTYTCVYVVGGFAFNEFVEPVLNYRCNEFVALADLCEMVPWNSHKGRCNYSLVILRKHS